jgi:hypothetical protein
MNPPLVNTTLTAPTSANAGVATAAEVNNPNSASTTDRLRYNVIIIPLLGV